MKIIDINSVPRNPSYNVQEKEIVTRVNRSRYKWYIVGVFIASVTAALLVWFFYFKQTKNLKAEDDAFQAIYHFEAGDFDKALNGDGVHKGFLQVVKEYPGTTTANLLCFYIGVAHMHKKEYDQALVFLRKFKVKDFLLQARAFSIMGDAYSEQKNHKQAAIYYMKAAQYKENSLYTPGYLVKAAIAFEADKQYKNAYDCYQTILQKYPNSYYGSGLAIKEASRLSAVL